MLNSDNSHFPFKLWQCCTIQFGPVTVAVMRLLLLFVARETTLLTSGTAASPKQRTPLQAPCVGKHSPCWSSFEQDTEGLPAPGSMLLKWPWPLTCLSKKAREKRVLMKTMGCEKVSFSWFVIQCVIWITNRNIWCLQNSTKNQKG